MILSSLGTDKNHGKKSAKNTAYFNKNRKKRGLNTEKNTASKCHILIDNAINKNCVLTKIL
jgi:hypothetical protein